MAADTLFTSTLWANAYFADMERVETGVECAFQFMAGFAVTADTSDTCTLMAWLSRWAALPFGLIVHCPPDMTARLLKHVTHNVEKMVKVTLVSYTWSDDWSDRCYMPALCLTLQLLLWQASAAGCCCTCWACWSGACVFGLAV